MAEPRSDGELARVAAIVRGGRGRSRLYRWLKARHDAFSALLAEERPDWRALAAGFAALGLTGRDGAALGPEACRHTWWRCRRDVAEARARRRATATPAVVALAPMRGVRAAGETGIVPVPGGADAAAASGALARLRAEMDRRSGRG